MGKKIWASILRSLLLVLCLSGLAFGQAEPGGGHGGGGGGGTGCITTGASILKGNGSGGCANATSPTDYVNGSSNLSAFAATTSAQLAAVISDETGTGLLVFASSPTIVTPTIASFTNATHNHQNAAGGGTLDAAAVASGTLSTSRLGSGTANSTTVLRGDSTWVTGAFPTSGLNQFASTTSAQLAGVISDETGTGLLAFATQPSLTRPLLVSTVFASLPAAGTADRTVVVTDCANTACSAGSGSTVRLMRDNGVSWVVLGDGDTGGTPSFNTITAGTNTAALIVGTGGSLTTSGSGTIAATTAAALAANGANCSSGQFAQGVDATGAAEGCTALPTSISGTANEISASASTGSVTLSLPSTLTLSSKTLSGASPLVFDGATADANKTTFAITDPTAARTVTFPDASGTVLYGTGAANQVAVFSGTNTASGSSSMTWDGTNLSLGSGNQIAISAATLTANRTVSLPDADSNTVQPASAGSNQFMTGISSAGVIAFTQPAFSNLSGSATDAQIPDNITLSQNSLTDYITATAIAKPASPAAGHVRIYANSGSGLLCSEDSAGTETCVGGGGGGGDNISVNGTAATNANFSDTTPGPGGTQTNVKWQKDASAPDNISAYVDLSAIAGAGLSAGSNALATASGEQGFIASGALTCGASTNGEMKVHTTPLQYCDNAATPALQYAAYGDSSGNAKELAGLSTTGLVKRTGAAAFTAATADTDYSTPSGSETFTNKTLDAEATGNIVTIPFKLYLPAAGGTAAVPASVWNLPASNPAVAVVTAGTNTLQGTLDFADGSSTLSAQTDFWLPSDWTGSIDTKFLWFSSTISGDVVWQIATICVDDGATNDPSFNTASTVTDTTKGTANQLNVASITGITTTGCSAGQLMHIKVLRDPTNGSDTMAGTARLIGIELTYRRAM